MGVIFLSKYFKDYLDGNKLFYYKNFFEKIKTLSFCKEFLLVAGDRGGEEKLKCLASCFSIEANNNLNRINKTISFVKPKTVTNAFFKEERRERSILPTLAYIYSLNTNKC